MFYHFSRKTASSFMLSVFLQKLCVCRIQGVGNGIRSVSEMRHVINLPAMLMQLDILLKNLLSSHSYTFLLNYIGSLEIVHIALTHGSSKYFDSNAVVHTLLIETFDSLIDSDLTLVFPSSKRHAYNTAFFAILIGSPGQNLYYPRKHR